jgi:hypothetical protein
MQNRQASILGKGKRFLTWRWLPAILYLALIHLASSGNPEDIGLSLPDGVDKLAHFSEFGLLALLFWRPLRDAVPVFPEMKIAAILFIFVAANGVLDEFHQSFVAGRESSWADGAADLLGGALAIAWLLHREKARPTATDSGDIN